MKTFYNGFFNKTKIGLSFSLGIFLTGILFFQGKVVLGGSLLGSTREDFRQHYGEEISKNENQNFLTYHDSKRNFTLVVGFLRNNDIQDPLPFQGPAVALFYKFKSGLDLKFKGEVIKSEFTQLESKGSYEQLNDVEIGHLTDLMKYLTNFNLVGNFYIPYECQNILKGWTQMEDGNVKIGIFNLEDSNEGNWAGYFTKDFLDWAFKKTSKIPNEKKSQQDFKLPHLYTNLREQNLIQNLEKIFPNKKMEVEIIPGVQKSQDNNPNQTLDSSQAKPMEVREGKVNPRLEVVNQGKLNKALLKGALNPREHPVDTNKIIVELQKQMQNGGKIDFNNMGEMILKDWGLKFKH